MNTVRVIGIGNQFAGDDALGVLIVRQLEGLQLTGVETIEGGLAGLTLLDLLEGVRRAIIIDAVYSGRPEGTIIRLEFPRDQDQITQYSWDSTTTSTHEMGLAETLALGATLGILPEYLSIIGIEMKQAKYRDELSAKGRQATQHVTSMLSKELGTMACTNFNSCDK